MHNNYVHRCIHIYIHALKSTHIHTQYTIMTAVHKTTCAHMHSCVPVCVCAYVYMHVHACTCMCISMHTIYIVKLFTLMAICFVTANT